MLEFVLGLLLGKILFDKDSCQHQWERNDNYCEENHPDLICHSYCEVCKICGKSRMII